MGRICPQGTPEWLQVGSQFLAAYVKGQPFDFTAANTTAAATASSAAEKPPIDPRTTEDCLFLDVIIPKQIFDSARANNTSGSPVLVWIYGGGYSNGDKSSFGNGAGLVKASQTSNSTGAIVVLLNYRVRTMSLCGLKRLEIALLTKLSLVLLDGLRGQHSRQTGLLMQGSMINVWHLSGCRPISTFSAVIQIE